MSDEWDDESGPFCRHWGDPSDCEEKCWWCGHRCNQHWGTDECDEDGCDCQQWDPG